MLLKGTGITALAVILVTSVAFSQRAIDSQSNCAVIEEALQETGNLKLGITRDKVEVSFVLDGGMQFGRTSRYLFRKCRSIKVDIEFADRGAGSPADYSSADKIVKVSRPYLELPAYD
jgi:hypothetical protein